MASKSQKPASFSLEAALKDPTYDFQAGQAAPEVGMGNAAAAAELEGKKENEDRSMMDYVSNARRWIGDELWEAVSPHLSEEGLGKYAQTGVTKSVDALDKYIQENGGADADQAALALFSQTLKTELSASAKALLGSPEGKALISKLRGWTQANAETIAYVALLAAAGALYYAYSKDMKIPELKQKFKLGDGYTGKVSADLGSLKNIGIDAIKAELEKSSGPLVGAVRGEYNGETGDWNMGANAAYAINPNLTVDGEISHNSAGETAGAAGLHYASERTQANLGYANNPNGQVVSADAAHQFESLPLETAAQGSYDVKTGKWNAGAQGKYTFNPQTTLDGRVALNSDGKTNTALDLNYAGVDTQANFGYSYADDKHRIAAGGSHKFNDRWSASGNAYAETKDFKDVSYGANGGLNYQKDNMSFGLNGGYDSQSGANVGVSLKLQF